MHARQIHSDHNGIRVLEVGAAHEYLIATASQVDGQIQVKGIAPISFQQGPVKEAGVNGVTNEALLAILIDRTEQLNKLYPCRENSIAITKMQEALMWFEKRTADRLARGVEGQSKQ